MRLPATIFAFLFSSSAVWAGDLTLAVRDGGGKPVANAVVMVYPAAASSEPIKFPWPYTVTQQDLAFDPYVLIVPVGADVFFPNHDKVRHHVYSFSPGNRFELKLYGREEKRSVKMKAAGVVAVGCNIHDQMAAFIRVIDTGYAAKTDAAGNATVHGVPGGAATVKVWHPDLRSAKVEGIKQLTVPAQGMVRDSIAIDVRASTSMAGMQH